MSHFFNGFFPKSSEVVGRGEATDATTQNGDCCHSVTFPGMKTKRKCVTIHRALRFNRHLPVAIRSTWLTHKRLTETKHTIGWNILQAKWSCTQPAREFVQCQNATPTCCAHVLAPSRPRDYTHTTVPTALLAKHIYNSVGTALLTNYITHTSTARARSYVHTVMLLTMGPVLFFRFCFAWKKSCYN